MGAAKPKASSYRQLRVVGEKGKSAERRRADLSLDPAATASATVLAFNQGTFGITGMTETFEALRESVRKVRQGDMAGPEAMLVTQADSLNAIFTEMARRAAMNMGEYINASERYMRLALKAQAQCRATVETLAALKNPPVVIARQANISNGPQQVNNGASPPRAEETSTVPNELLETDHGKRLDAGAAGTPVASDPALVAVDANHRA